MLLLALHVLIIIFPPYVHALIWVTVAMVHVTKC